MYLITQIKLMFFIVNFYKMILICSVIKNEYAIKSHLLDESKSIWFCGYGTLIHIKQFNLMLTLTDFTF